MMSISQEFCSDYFRLLMQIHDELLLEVLDSDLDLVTGNNNKKFRSFESKENIHKKEVGPYHGFGY